MPLSSYFLRIGPFVVHLSTRLAAVRRNIERCYADQMFDEAQPFADFHIELDALINPHLLFRPQCQFWLDGKTLFKPLPINQAPAFFEWGLNWCIGQFAHHYLQLHAAVVAYDDKVAILIGAPGSGKSTLCAALTLAGWRLLSDEFALIATDDLRLAPLPRPISLKNESIDLIRGRAPEADLGDPMSDTSKGTVAHLKQPAASVRAMNQLASPRWMILPKYSPGRDPELHKTTRAQTAIQAADQSFNYGTLGRKGFDTLTDVMEGCDCYELLHNDLDWSVRTLTDLAKND